MDSRWMEDGWTGRRVEEPLTETHSGRGYGRRGKRFDVSYSPVDVYTVRAMGVRVPYDSVTPKASRMIERLGKNDAPNHRMHAYR